MVEVKDRTVRVSNQCFSRYVSHYWEFLTSESTFGISNHAHTIGVKEKRRQVNEIVSIIKSMTRFVFSYTRPTTKASIFFVKHYNEEVTIFRTNHDRHPFLCDSEMDFCIIFKPWYLKGLVERSISRPSANSPIATQTACPTVIGLLDQTRVTLPLREALRILRSSGIYLLNTSAPAVSRLNCLNTLEEHRTTDTITTCFTSERRMNTSCFRFFTDTTLPLGRTNNGNKFHTCSYKERVEEYSRT